MVLFPWAMIALSGLLAAAEPSLPRVALLGPLDPAVVSRFVSALDRRPIGVAIRLDLELSETTAPADMEARLAAYEALGVQLWPVVEVPPEQAEADRWRPLLQRWLARHRGHVAVLEMRVADQPLAVVRFAIQAAATDLQVGGAAGRLAIGGPVVSSGRLTDLIDATVAPYVDLIAAPSPDVAGQALAAVQPIAPAVKGVLVDQQLPAGADAARTAMIDLQIEALGTSVHVPPPTNLTSPLALTRQTSCVSERTCVVPSPS